VIEQKFYQPSKLEALFEKKRESEAIQTEKVAALNNSLAKGSRNPRVHADYGTLPSNPNSKKSVVSIDR